MRRGELWRSPSSIRDRVVLLVTSQTLDSTLNSQIKSVYTTPFWVTTKNMEDTIIKDGWLSPSDLCTGDVKQACTKYGIQ